VRAKTKFPEQLFVQIPDTTFRRTPCNSFVKRICKRTDTGRWFYAYKCCYS